MIVGISGKEGSGKTTLANYIVSRSHNRIVNISFADALKEVSAMILGVDPKMMSDRNFKNQYMDKWGMTVGQFLQWFGTDVCRAKNDDVWVDLLLKRASESDVDIVIDDVRFVNEAEAIIMQQEGVMIRLNGDPEDVRKNSKRDQNHISETALDDFFGFDLVMDTDDLDVNGMGRMAYDFLRNKFNRKFSMVKDLQVEYEVKAQSFEQMFGRGFAQCIRTKDDLYNKRAIDIVVEMLKFINEEDKDYLVCVPRNGSAEDIHPKVVGGKLVSLIVDSVDANRKRNNPEE